MPHGYYSISQIFQSQQFDCIERRFGMNQSPATGSGGIHGWRLVAICLLTMFAFGPQYVLNVSFILNQGLIQNTFASGANALTVPSTLSNLAFAACVPVGPVLTRRFGLRHTYISLVLMFLLGSIIAAISPTMWALVIGRLLQGLSAGALFLTILPVSLMSFPNAIRNWFLLLAIGGLFGASAFGTLFGALTISADAWRWLFVLCGIAPIFCLIVGLIALPREHVHEHQQPFDIWGAVVLAATVTVTLFPLIHLKNMGIGSLWVWPLFVLAAALFATFVFIELHSKAPLVHYRSVRMPKQIFGFLMAVISHVGLILALIGGIEFLRAIKGASFTDIVHFAVWFVCGVVIVALISVFLYDLVGAGALGIAGSFVVMLVAWKWHNASGHVSYPMLAFDFAAAATCIGLVLIAGALGTALAGDIHEARWRSGFLHFHRNLLGALIAPFSAWFLTKDSAIQYEQLRSHISLADPLVSAQLASITQRLMANGTPQAQAQQLAVTTVLTNAQQASLLSALHGLFTIMFIVGCMMLVSSIGMAATGKGRALVQRQKPLTAPQHIGESLPAPTRHHAAISNEGSTDA